MKKSNPAASAFLMGLAAFILIECRKLPFGSMRGPQTGFFPSVLAVLLLMLSLILVVWPWSHAEDTPAPDKIAEDGWVRIGLTLVIMILFAFILERIGFFLSTFILMILLLRAVESQSWLKVLAIAAGTALTAYAIFGWLLGIPLPSGVLLGI